MTTDSETRGVPAAHSGVDPWVISPDTESEIE